MTVKSLMVLIGVDPSSYEAGMNKVKASLEKHQKTFTAIGGTMTAIGGVMTAFFGKCVSEAVKSEAAEAKLYKALSNVAGASKTGADMLFKYAGALQKTTGIEDEEIKNAMALLATYGLNERQIAALTPRVLDMAVAHSKATGGEIDLTNAAMSLGRAVTGHVELLGRQGVVLSEQTKKTGDFALVLKDVDKAFGGAAAAAGQTFAGQMRILKTNIGETMEAIGGRLLPVLLPLVTRIGNVVKRVLDWMDVHQGLVKTLVPVLAGVGGLLTILGPVVIILPKIVGGVMLLAKSFIFLATNPIVLVVAALGVMGVAIYKVVAAMKEAQGAQGIFNIANKEMVEILMEASRKAGLTAIEYDNLCKKYNGNVMAIREAILQEKEGLFLKLQLIIALNKHGKAVEDEGEAYKKAKDDLEAFLKNLGNLGNALPEIDDKIKKLKITLTDDLKKATLSEVEYEKWAAGEKLKARQEEITTEVLNAGKRKELLLLAELGYEAEIRKINLREKIDRTSTLITISEENKKFLENWLNNLKAFAVAKAEVEHLINMTSLKGIKAELAQIENARAVKISELMTEYKDNVAQRDALIELWEEYYDKLKAVTKKSAIWEALKQIKEAVINLFGSWDQLISANKEKDLKATEEKYNAQIAALDQIYAKTKTFNDAEKKKKETAIEADAAAKAAQVEKDTTNEQRKAATVMAIEGEKQAKLKALAAKGATLTEAERVKEKAQIEADAAAKVAAMEKDITDEEIKAAALEAIKAEEVAKLEALDAEAKAKQTEQEDKLAKDKAKIEEDLAKEKERVQKEAGRAQKRIALITAAMNIAEAITKALTGAIPPWNFILAGITAAAGAVQLAAIGATSFGKGGYVDRPTLAVVGDVPEWIIPESNLARAGAGEQINKGRASNAQQPVHIHVNNYIGGEKVQEFVIKVVQQGFNRKTFAVPAKVIV